MRGFGYFVVALGAAYMLFAFNMDVSVSTPTSYVPGLGAMGGGEVANLDLMARRQNHLIVAALITLIGALMVIFGGERAAENTPVEVVKDSTVLAEFEGERDLSRDPYRLWLASKHEVARNEVFDRFVMGDCTFDNLDSALAAAHDLEVRAAAEAAEREEARQARIAANREANRIAAEEEEARWREQQPKVIVGAVLVILLFVGAIFIFKESPSQRAARERAEARALSELIVQTEKKFSIELPSDAMKVQVGPVTPETAFRCDDRQDGTIIVFSTRLQKEQIKESFRKSLGRGSPEYEYLDDSFDWNWTKDRRKYMLRMFSESVSNAAYLCVVEEG